MRKIEQRMLQAIKNKENWSSANTTIAVDDMGGMCKVFLHGSHIANVWQDGTLWVNRCTLALYPTNTTKSRLRALGANVNTKNGVTYLDGVAV